MNLLDSCLEEAALNALGPQWKIPNTRRGADLPNGRFHKAPEKRRGTTDTKYYGESKLRIQK